MRVNWSENSRSGLSPRRRGNPFLAGAFLAVDGSIPAQAGEPNHFDLPTSFLRVYPRAGGGTFPSKVKALIRSGLSPRRRGNPAGLRMTAPVSGSIPAQAGEP